MTDPVLTFEDADVQLFALRVALAGVDGFYYVMTMPRLRLEESGKTPGKADVGIVDLDLHPAPIDPVLNEMDARAGLDYLNMLLSAYGDPDVILLDNAREPRSRQRVVSVSVVRVSRTFWWTEEPLP
jgi:hypothetical protein